jgi:signal peptidase II
VVYNVHIGLGFMRDPRLLAFLLAAAALGTIFLIHTISPLGGPTPRAALGAVVGGAAGNFSDVLRRGAVVDFIDLRIWPVFNIADVAIVAGAAVVCWTLLNQ